MIKLIASDLDGTLLQSGAQSLNPEVFDLILKLKEKGIRFIAASGRQYASMRRLFEPVKDEISYITENGSLCIHEGAVFKKNCFERSLALRIMEEIRRRENCELLLSCEDTYYVESEKLLRHMRDDLHSDVIKVPDASAVTKPFLKLAVYDDVTTKETARYFYDKFAAEIPVATSGNVWMDFIVPGANKGAALQVFLNHFDCQPEECMAFGDQQNDLEMLDLAGESYAMKNAASGVSEHAKHTTDSVEAVLRKLLEQR